MMPSAAASLKLATRTTLKVHFLSSARLLFFFLFLEFQIRVEMVWIKNKIETPFVFIFFWFQRGLAASLTYAML